MRGTTRARLRFVPLSTSPPGLGVVCLRTVHVHALRSMSPARTPATSPILAAVARLRHDGKDGYRTDPHPSRPASIAGAMPYIDAVSHASAERTIPKLG